ncbi:MAG: hypothetical protein ACRD4U_01875 [Candidatus Acidiferrales bacterium]
MGSRWLSLVRVASWASLVFLAIVLMATFADRHDFSARALATWWLVLLLWALPYIAVLVLLRAKQETSGLAVAMGWGLAGLVDWWWMPAQLKTDTLYGTSSLIFLMSFPLVIMIQTVLIVSAAIAQVKSGRMTATFGKTAMILVPIVVAGLFLAPISYKTAPHRGTGNNESSAVGSLRWIIIAQVTYTSTYGVDGVGFAPSLAALGPPPGGGKPGPEAADLIDARLASGEKNGYRFTLVPGPLGAQLRVTSYVVLARPIQYNRTGLHSFYSDESGAILWTDEDRAATAKDKPIM